MKNKNIIGFIFIFSLFFTNLIPYTLLTIYLGDIRNNTEFIQLINLFTSLNYSQYFNTFFHIFVYFVFIKFLTKAQCKSNLITLFSLGFIGILLLNLAYTNVFGLYSQDISYSNNLNNYVNSISTIIQLLNIGLITMLSIVLLLILIEIKNSIKHYVMLFISTIFLNFMFVVYIIYKYLLINFRAINSDFVANYITVTTITLITFIATVIFKVFVITETVEQTITKDYHLENN